jgi:hypothetical protein
MTETEDAQLRNELARAEAAVKAARRRKDREALAVAIERRERLARRAGLEFWKRRRSAKDRLAFNGAQIARLTRFCTMDDDTYEISLAAIVTRIVASVGYSRPDVANSCNIKTVVSPWVRDEFGNLTRTVSAVDNDKASDRPNLNSVAAE